MNFHKVHPLVEPLLDLRNRIVPEHQKPLPVAKTVSQGNRVITFAWF